MKIENIKEWTWMELLTSQSEVMSRFPQDIELKDQIYEELKRRRKQKNKLPGAEQ
jgi:hypothetical protein